MFEANHGIGSSPSLRAGARHRPKHRALALLLAASAASLATPALADDTRPSFASFDLPGDRVFPESITATADGTLYTGSLGQGGVFRRTPGSDVPEQWIAPGAFGTRNVFGLFADERAGLLWVCSNDISALGATVPGDTTGSWLKGFDLNTGEGKVSAPFPTTPALCNEITVSAAGGVYVTNTLAPEILRLSDDRAALEVWATGPDLPQPDDGPGLDGLAFGSDGHLYANSYGKGDLLRIAVENGKAGKVTRLSTSRPLVMPDTMRQVEGTTFLMVEGGGRLTRVVVDGDHARIETLAEGFALPTSFAVAGGTAWVAEGQLDHVFDAAKKDTPPVLPFKVYGVPLESASNTSK